MIKPKVLIVSGDSFTFEPWNWPTHLANSLNIDLINVAMGSQGNGLITKKLIYNLTKALKIYKPEEILVGVMWSNFPRTEFYFENINQIPKGGNIDGWVENPTGIIEGNENKKWWICNSHWKNKISRTWYENFYSNTSCALTNIYDILLAQLFLKQNNIEYFMTTISKIFLFYQKEIESPEVSYVYDLLDFDKFIPISGCNNWLSENYGNESFSGISADEIINIKNNDSGHHPNENGHKIFVKEIILPFLKDKQII